MRNWLTGVATLLLLGSCAAPEVDLLDEDREISERRTRRMNLVVQQWNASTSSWAEPTELTVNALNSHVLTHCEGLVAQSSELASCFPIVGNSCSDDAVCPAALSLCAALTFRELASSVATTELYDGATASVRVPRQDAESRAALEQAAQLRARDAVRDSAVGLQDSAHCSGARLKEKLGEKEGTAGEQTVGEFLASTMVEALHIGEAAAEHGAELALGAAQRDRAAIPHRGQAARLSWFDANLSNLVAAQAIVGGVTEVADVTKPFALSTGAFVRDEDSPSHFDLTETGIGAPAPCVGQCRTALNLLRLSGAPFDQILEHPLTGSTTPTDLDTLVATQVSPRLAVLLNMPELDPSGGTGSGLAAAALAEHFNITANTLREAREWMIHEAATFARPDGLTLATDELPTLMPNQDGTPRTLPGGMTLDLTTRSAPRPPPPIHFLTAARAGAMWDNAAAAGVNSSLSPPARAESAYLFDFAHTAARDAIASERVTGAAVGVLASLTQEAIARRAGRAELCGFTDEPMKTDFWRLRVFGVPDTDLRVVEGTTEMRCATEGRIEGRGCDLLPEVGTRTASPAVLSSSNAGWRHHVEWTFSSSHGTDRPYWYVLRLRPGRQPGPGAYEAVAGLSFDHVVGIGDPDNYPDCMTVPFDDSSLEGGSAIFAIDSRLDSPGLCGVVGPVPLEDEIVEDHDSYEDSWRYHLDVAARTAAHADEMGQRLLQSGLEMDSRAEQALDTLVELCGVPVNLDALFNADGTAGSISLDDLVGTGTCDEASGTPACAAGYQCLNTTCVAETLVPEGTTEAEVEALLSCLGLSSEPGESGVVPVVGLGTQPLCLWRDSASPDVLCSGADGNCPYAASDINEDGILNIADCTWTLPPGQEHVFIGEESLLSLYEQIPPGGMGTTGPGSGVGVPAPDCDLVRRARRGEFMLPQIIESRFYDAENLRRWARRIGWRALPLDYSELTLDGSPWRHSEWGAGEIASTGYPFTAHGRPTGPTVGHWPCGQKADHVACADGDGSLLCNYVTNCSDAAARAAFNRRLGRAAVTLATVTGVGLDQFWLPAHYEGVSTPSLSYERSVETWSDSGGGTWRVASEGIIGGDTYSGWFVVPPPDSVVWRSTRSDGDGIQLHGSGGKAVDELHPFGFVNFGTRFHEDDDARARRMAHALWQGMAPGPHGFARDEYGEPANFVERHVACVDVPGIGGGTFNSCPTNLMQSVLHHGDGIPATTVRFYGRSHFDTFRYLSHLFSEDVYDTSTDGIGFIGNEAHIFEPWYPSGEMSDDLTQRDLLDAMELVCEVARGSGGSVAGGAGGCMEGGALPIYTMSDLGTLQSRLVCTADRMDALAQRRVAQNVPADVVSALRGQSRGMRPDVGGYGRSIATLRSTLRDTAQVPRQVASELRGIGEELELLKSFQRELALEETNGYLRALAGAIDAASQCASAAGSPLDGISAGAVCTLAAAKTAVIVNIAVNEAAILDERARQAFVRFRSNIGPRLDALVTLEEAIANSDDTISAQLSALQSSRDAARAALARAGFADSDAAGRQFHLNTAMRRSYNINLQRYRNAQQAAVRSAVVARRAVEQRFGVDLDVLDCGTLVEPPSSWASDICNAEGLNYAALRDADAPPPTDESVRQMFVGDYVRRLEQWVESYRFDFPYSSGDDTLVLSLRDDVMTLTAPCVAASDNLLGASNDLSRFDLPAESGVWVSDAGDGWHVPVGGCNTHYDSSLEAQITSNCVAVSAQAGPGASGLDASAPPRGFDVTFAPNCDVSSVCDYTNDAAVVQEITLNGGVYRLSFYGKDAAAVDVASVASLEMQTDVGGDPVVFAVDSSLDEVLSSSWVRYFRYFRVPYVEGGTTVSVGLWPDAMMVPVPQRVEVAGLQLEFVTDTVGTRSNWNSLSQADVDAEPHVFYPDRFIATTAQGYALFDTCSTDEPAEFTPEFTYQCDRVCRGGLSTERCLPDEAPELVCYWEYPFRITEEQLLQRESGFGGGFAFGNFNYRSGEIAVNVVGTGVRDCDGPGSRACHATGTVPFSLTHEPLGEDRTYLVSTHEGGSYNAQLFPGRIESARALAAERYLTNPVSGSDRALLSDYMRRELRGRPLPGRYVIRVWDAPGVNFSAVEDIQILWNYRYFTRTAENSCRL